jgi:hypothetical protein
MQRNIGEEMSAKDRDYTFNFTRDGRVWIKQKGWGMLVYDFDDLVGEIKAIQRAEKGTITPEEAADRIYVLKAAQEALIGR